MRKLASIRLVTDAQPIPERDFIENIFVDGWSIIAKKDEFKIGDMCIFIEPDSLLPESNPNFEFLRSKKFKIKTMKMKGILSQGICFPLSILPQGKQYNIEDDVTDILGIKQFDKDLDEIDIKEVNTKFKHPIFKILFKYSILRRLLLTKKENRGFPIFISKTDEPRVQNIPHMLKNKDIRYLVHEKIDGQSGSFFLKKIHSKFFWQKDSFDFGVCSRNMRLWNETNTSYWFVAKKYNIKNVLENLIGGNDFVAIQGECISPSVQGNKYKVTEPDLYCFNLIYPTGKVDSIKAEEILKPYGLKWCPLVSKDYTLLDSVNDMLEYSTGKSALFNTLREGVILRCYEKNISFKAVSPDFLIKHNL